MARVARETSPSDTIHSDAIAFNSTRQSLTPLTSFSESSTTPDSTSTVKPAPVAPTTRRVTRASLNRSIDYDARSAIDTAHKQDVASGQGISASLSVEKGQSDVTRGLASRQLLRASSGRRVLRNTEIQETVDNKDNNEISTTGGDEIQLNTSAEPLGMKSRRRSTRISMLEKTKFVLNKVSSVLGKRVREANEMDKPASTVNERRASLRARNTPQATSALQTEPTDQAKKKRRISDSVASRVKDDTEDTVSASVPYKRKRWLTHGLYAAENAYADFKLPIKKTRRTGSSTRNAQESAILPLPRFSGARLLEEGRDFRLPYDIFSPLPRGQPKPDEWRKINKNIFVGDAASIWKATMLNETSTCLCTAQSGCGENCQNRYMLYECDDSNCRLDAELCGNRNFAELRRRTKAGGKYDIGVEVIKTENRGYGVRSSRSFEPNQIILEYTGEILTQEECERRMRTIYKKSECYYLMYFDQNMVIDATRGSIARFVNHSCEPNCKMEKWTVAGKPRIALFAGENGIMTGEELSYDYNFDPYSQKNVQQCFCGTPSCRGILGPRPKAPAKSNEPKEQKIVRRKYKKRKQTTTRTKRKSDAELDEPGSQSKKSKMTRSVSIKAKLKRVASKTAQTLKTKKIKVFRKKAAVKFPTIKGGSTGKSKGTAGGKSAGSSGGTRSRIRQHGRG
ncbi:hypothetical protein FQN57_004883 [Myotisia sp. PD_48]|nr:hypothetical protein FQN57_004883 [Myotisia sp. PD_48]